MDRCELAFQYHQSGYNCAQSVLMAFADLTKVDPQVGFAVAGGLGGGIGGTHQEVCGAISGGVMSLSLLFPYTDSAKPEDKRRVTGIAKEFLKRFQERFGGLSRCGDLLTSRVEATEENTPAAVRVGAKKHCDIMIVTAVEIVEELLKEAGVL